MVKIHMLSFTELIFCIHTILYFGVVYKQCSSLFNGNFYLMHICCINFVRLVYNSKECACCPVEDIN